MSFRRRHRRRDLTEVETPTFSPPQRRRIPSWSIIQTMMATVTIGSLVLDRRRKARAAARARHGESSTADET